MKAGCALLVLVASYWTPNAMAQSAQFTIDMVERAAIQVPGKPGQGLVHLAKFHWRDSSQSWVASVPDASCERNPDVRVGTIGSPNSSSGILASRADKDYQWQWEGPKPTDKLFTAICSQS